MAASRSHIDMGMGKSVGAGAMARSDAPNRSRSFVACMLDLLFGETARGTQVPIIVEKNAEIFDPSWHVLRRDKATHIREG